jgi:protein TonB
VSTENEHPTPSSDGGATSKTAEPVDKAPADEAAVRDTLSTNTSLDDLYNAILGDDARESDERGPIMEAVEAQVREIREEVGLVETPHLSRPLPEFVPVFRTQPPEGLLFSRTIGTPWTVARPRRWAGLLDLTASRAVRRAVLVAVPAAAALFVVGLYFETTSGSPLPTPTPPALRAVHEIDEIPTGADALKTTVVVRTSNAEGSVEVPASTPPPVDDTRRDAAVGSVVSPAPPRASTTLASVATPRAEAPLPATAPSIARTLVRPADIVSVSLPIGTTGTSAPPQPPPPAPSPGSETTPTRPAISEPAEVTSSAPVADQAAAAPIQPPGVGPTPDTTSATSRTSREAVLISRVPPVYPDLARRLGTTGNVDLDVEIDAVGRVVRASSVTGPRVLRDAAESAVLQWRYQPQLTGGVAVTSRRRVRVSFQ